MSAQANRESEHPESLAADAATTKIRIGQTGKTLRVLNFSGGGFDSTMQLGVTHALLVSQGKAPDVVVGVSAGAIQAVALAEVMHAGELPSDEDELQELKQEQYESVLGERVIKLRQFIDASQRAPETILDSVVPDAYQIDSFDPLRSLQLPRLSKEEREDRNKWIIKKSGLVRLYNDLLSLDLPFGTITRLVRRILGFSAAGALGNWLKRLIVKSVELMRIWLLVGTQLRRLTPLILVLLRPVVRRSASVQPKDVGSIIFKFPIIDRPLKGALLLLTFLLLVNSWVLLSWLVVLPIGLIPLLADEPGAAFWNLFYLIYIVPLALPLTPVARAFNRTKFFSALKNLSKGIVAFTLYLLKWSAVYLFLLTAISGVASVIVWMWPGTEGGLFSPYQSIGPIVVLSVLYVTAILGPLVLLVAVFTRFILASRIEKTGIRTWYQRRFLDFYGLGSSISDNYCLKKFLIEIFDPDYYGKVESSPVIQASLTDKDDSQERKEPQRKRIRTYVDNKPSIVVALAAADVESGKLVVVDQDSTTIEGLLAATAVNPIYPPQEILVPGKEKRLFVDGMNIGNIPTKGLVEVLANEDLADVDGVHIYAVDPLPVSKPKLGPSSTIGAGSYENLIDVAVRALHLQRFRDATIERKLTKLITDVIPPDNQTPIIFQGEKPRKFFRGVVTPIELESPADLNRKILFGDKEQRRNATFRIIADGCRASLQVMLNDTLEFMRDCGDWPEETTRGFINCSEVVTRSKRRRSVVNFDLKDVQLPGSVADQASGKCGPGLSEICEHCSLRQKVDGEEQIIATQCLKFADPENPNYAADWPLELSDQDGTFPNPPPPPKPNILEPKDSDPMRACLFSGGVFRGVFQMGVLNALNLLELRPNMVAGASVGSITAAMVASALQESDETKKAIKIAELSVVYLGIDRIILTDKFADFIRNWTIRAAEAKFSLRQADEVFRKYDNRSTRAFQKDFRQVVAGLERLFYINPYQLNEIAKAIRNRESSRLRDLSKGSVQKWLDRMGVGNEVLGAEAIQLLIDEFVVPSDYEDHPEITPFNCFGDDFHFLATTTNLTEGSLELLGRSSDNHNEITLREGLLASSAFPGVFRPRRSWDLMPGTDSADQYIDGGVMDNLPVDPVLEEMSKLADDSIISKRPADGPHLMLAASLEVEQKGVSSIDADRYRRYWPELLGRTNKLKYNIKLDTFANVARNIQDIHRQLEGSKIPLNVKVLSIKPRWLCSTFAFHPMLGFRQKVQAQSIAHGCAATLLAFADISEEDGAAWSIRQKTIPEKSTFKTAFASAEGFGKKVSDGACWLQQEKKCPYSRSELSKLEGSKFSPGTIRKLSHIHKLCWNRKTHDSKKK